MLVDFVGEDLGEPLEKTGELGIIRFTGTIHSENIAIRRLLEKVMGVYETKSAGTGAVEVAVDLR